MNYRMLKEDLNSHIECSSCRISGVQKRQKFKNCPHAHVSTKDMQFIY